MLSFTRGAAGFCIALFTFAPGAWAQEALTSGHVGRVQDWSEHHIVFTRDGLAQHPDLIYREPRVQQQVMQRLGVPNYGAFQSADTISPASHKSSPRDWSQALGGHMNADAFPAKYNFYVDTTPSCSTDYVVFGLTNTNGANLVGLNNLYVNTTGTGFCTGLTAPTALFAYNIAIQTGGHIITSPILSLDGTKVAFVESVPANGGIASAYFDVVTTTQGGTLTAPVTPTGMFNGQLTLAGGDTHSSPWIDYSNDVVYVGTDDGFMHKVTGVFKGTPAVDPIGSGWPLLVAAGLHMSPPVLDEDLGVLIVGGSNGDLYQISTTTNPPVVVNSISLGSGLSEGIVSAPVVDVTNDSTFVVTADDGVSGAIFQVRTSAMVQRSVGELGLGSSGSPGTALTLYEPALSNDYFPDPSNGVMTLCGTGPSDTSPYQYVFGFNGTLMKEAPLFKQQLSTSTAARCSGWTEFFNPNIGAGGTDFFFFGLTQDCTSITGTVASGCIAEETNLTPASVSAAVVKATLTGGPSGIIIDNYANPVTYPEASSTYCTALRLNAAYKFTQNGLTE